MPNDPIRAAAEGLPNARPNADPAEERAATWFKMAQSYERALLDIERITALARQELCRSAEDASSGYVIPTANFDSAVALLNAICLTAKNAEAA